MELACGRDCEPTEHEADEKASTVTHEDTRACAQRCPHVEAQETEHSTHQRKQDIAWIRKTGVQGSIRLQEHYDRKKPGQGSEGDSTSQSVGTIDEVHSVDDAENSEHCKWHSERSERERLRAD
jgi:hypothetical protein